MPDCTCPRRPRGLTLLTALLIGSPAWAAPPTAPSTAPSSPPGTAEGLPTAITRSLAQAQIPVDALSLVVQEADTGAVRLRWNDTRPRNPASITKLLTTYAALETFGPSWTWRTPVWLDGKVVGDGPDAFLDGHLHIKGVGDPKLVLERIEALLQQVRARGVRHIRGDIVIDQSTFAEPPQRPGDFDGEPLRPYNVQARALMLNQRTVTYTFTPDPKARVARIRAEPMLQGVRVEATVPLTQGPCQDWRAELRPQFHDPNTVGWAGRYPHSCGEREWPVAYVDPGSYDRRLLEALWTSMGGRLEGRVREGPSPATPPTFEWASPPLGEVVRDINRHSNNVMAQQLALTLAAPRPTPPGGTDALMARSWLERWARDRLLQADSAMPGLRERTDGGIHLENGSGLSRDQRLSAQHIAALLQRAWAGPFRSHLLDSLPMAGARDGTLRRMGQAAGLAQLKTGSLKDVVGIAGYVTGRSGKRWILVAIVNHPSAQAGRAALDEAVQWAIQDPDNRPVKAEAIPALPSAAERPLP